MLESSSSRSAASLKYAMPSPKTETSRAVVVMVVPPRKDRTQGHWSPALRSPWGFCRPRTHLASNVEPEGNHVALLHDVVLAFAAHLACRTQRLHRAIADVVIVADDLRTDESALEVAMDPARRLGCFGPPGNRPRANLLLPGRQERHEADQVVGGARQLLQPGTLDPQLRAECAGLLRRQPGQLCFDLPADGHHAASLGGGQLFHCSHQRSRATDLLFADIGDVE